MIRQDSWHVHQLMWCVLALLCACCWTCRACAWVDLQDTVQDMHAMLAYASDDVLLCWPCCVYAAGPAGHAAGHCAGHACCAGMYIG